MDFESLPSSLPHLYGQLRAHAALVDRQLSDGRAYLLGEVTSWADVLAYFVIWMSRANITEAQTLFSSFASLQVWEVPLCLIVDQHPEIPCRGGIGQSGPAFTNYKGRDFRNKQSRLIFIRRSR